ncbi:flavodoxin [Centipeda periodontii DSM 2778]|uniref:Flavodoxin n=1 Tax=Centipeda periodontii DSM 2778 TaxID=888060 RepID=F5RQQ0_9FIRM|nr:flavodoxin [Centipeda periodontii]EGK56671.1 flavodoxin [Centipeda periodontii DSM 2778]
MAKVAVVYWSGTGNTQKMAEAVVEGAQGAGADVECFEVDSFSVDQIDDFDGLALGCPSMGAEELEEGSYEPFFAEAVDSGKLSGKPVVLFGSWGWGAGAWMETWSERTTEAGAKLVNTFIVENEPDEEGVQGSKDLGAELVSAL